MLWHPVGASKENHQALQRAVNHYHADLYRKYSDRLTPVAGILMTTPEEAIEELEFAVKTLKLKVINISGGVKRPIKALADKYPADKFPEIAKYASYIDFFGINSEYDYWYITSAMCREILDAIAERLYPNQMNL